MSITMTELFDSEALESSFDGDSIELRYGLFGSEDLSEIYLHLEEELPDEFFGLPWRGYRLTPQGGDVFFVTASYSSSETRKEDRDVSSYDSQGGTIHVERSLSTVASGNAAGITGTPPDFKGSIGVSGDAVAGVDIVSNDPVFTITRTKKSVDASNEFVTRLLRIRPCVNNGAFRGFDAGEVLFMSMSAVQRNTEEWEFTWRFAIRQNEYGSEFAADPDSFVKDGWDYLWWVFERDVSSGYPVVVPKHYYIERVYPRRDFVDLGIDD